MVEVRKDMVSQTMETKKKLFLPIYKNWIDFKDNKPSHGCSEYPLFSDAHITGENISDFGPYQFINPCSFPTSSRKPKIALILRVDERLGGDYYNPDMNRTDTSCYHGGDLIDEIAAVVSLALGVRIKGGGRTREFLPDDNKYGRPIGWEECFVPEVSPEYGRYKLISVMGERNITLLDPLKHLAELPEKDVVYIIKAARLYQDALWITESAPSLSWVMLVSAIETATEQWQKRKESPEQKLKFSQPELCNYLCSTNVPNIIEKVASYMIDFLGATKKFVDFVLNFLPEPPEKRPPEYLQHKWEKAEMEKTMKSIYNYRSRALHNGTPFPFPMCEPPYGQKDFNAPAEKPIGLGTYAQSGTWKIEDTPMLINTFEYIARNCLLNWWKSLSAEKLYSIRGEI